MAQKSSSRRTNRRKRLLKRYTTLFLASFAVCICCAGVSIRILMEERDAASTNRSARALMLSGAQAENVQDGAVLLADGVEAGTISSDFTELAAANADLIGWVTAGAAIDLPVVQGADNVIYLNRDFYGGSNSAGSIFLDAENSVSDDHLVIYGHNMKSGSMFGQLPNYRQLDYLKQYPIVQFRTIYQSAAEAGCVPFAVFDASMDAGDADYFSIRQFNFDGDEARQAFIDELKSRSIFNIPVDVDASDQPVSLVTCSYSNDDGRFILAMRRLRDGEDAQTLAAIVAQSVQK